MENNLIYKEKKKVPYLIWILIGALFILLLLNISIGSSDIGIKEIFEAIKGENELAKTIIVYVRLPRIIACVFVGAGLAVSGLILQSVLNNSLASPGIIGINSGAGLGVVLFAIIFPSTFSILGRSIGAFLGAMLASFLIYGIARLTGASRGVIILAGIAISRLFSAISDAIVLLDPTILTNKTAFSLGSLSGINIESLEIACPIIFICLILSLFLSKRLDILSLGDDEAYSLGLNVKLTRFLALVLASLLASLAVSIAGLLSFLGLICPHIIRRIIGSSNHKRLTVLTMLFGAALTLLCDLISRTLFAPHEIPVGIIMAFIGVPFFIFLLFSRRRRDRYDLN